MSLYPLSTSQGERNPGYLITLAESGNSQGQQEVPSKLAGPMVERGRSVPCSNLRLGQVSLDVSRETSSGSRDCWDPVAPRLFHVKQLINRAG
jgi:hypothetical protein